MNLQISCQVNGNTEYIELGGVDKVTLDVSFAEIQDITKKNSAYSKEFNVPGTNGNNYIFEYFFDLNQVPLNFIPTKKFEAQLLYNGYLIASGYIRLNTVTTVKEQKTYNITFYNGVGDVAATIGDKFMAQLDLSSLSHPFNANVYQESQLDWNLFTLTGTTNYSYQNGKTFWPLLNIGYNYTPSLSAITSNYITNSTTSISITSGQKTITTSIPVPFLIGETIRLTATPSGNYIQGVVNGITGTTIQFTPNLGLGTGTYSNWLTSRQLLQGEEIPDPQSTPIVDFQREGVPNYISFSGTPVKSFYFKPAIQVKELYEQIFNQSGYYIDSEFLRTNYFERFYYPLKFLDETIYTRGAEVLCFTYDQKVSIGGSLYPIQQVGNAVLQTGITCVSSAITYDLTGFTIPTAYTSDTFSYIGRVSYEFEGVQDPSCTYPYFYDVLFGTSQSTAQVVYSEDFCNDLNPSQLYSVSFDFPITGFGVNQGFFITGSNIPSIYNFKFELISPPIIFGNFNYAAEFPTNDYKQIDFITSINKFFNLVVIPDPIKPNTLIVEPIIDYIGKGKIIDWTSKIDWDSPITISPTSNILNGTLNFNFGLDQDYGNQQFNISSNRVFGTYKQQLNQDYKDNNIDINLVFGSPTDIGLTNSSGDALTVSNMAAIKNENINGQSIQKYNPYKILQRIIFRGPVIPNTNWGIPQGSGSTQVWWAETTPISYWPENSRFTTYPFSLTGFSHYINWNAQDTTDLIQTNFPTQQDMYDIYYYDYISDILAPENKIMKAKIYLTPYEIADLRFNEKIIIKNSYWRINKITGYNLTEPSLCDIELIKLTKDYTPHPVLYYDLISCTGGTDYHSTSDLNYNLYAYAGNYVNLFTGSTTGYTSLGCYQVQIGQPNPNYNYEQVFIGSGYTNSGVSVYSDCGCSATTQFNIVQQEYPEPTTPPQPTPSATPQPTPSMTPSATPQPTPSMTPSATPPSGDPDANAYLEAVVQAGGTGITATVSAATQTMFVDLKSAGIYTKLNALYPFLGGIAASAKFNALNPIDSDAAFRLVFNGGGTFSQDKGYLGNGANAYADTKWVQSGQTTTGNTSIGVFISVTGASGFDIGSTTSGTWLAFDPARTNTNFRGAVETGLINFTGQTAVQAINFNALSRANNSTVLFVARGSGVQSVASTGLSQLQNFSILIGQCNQFGDYSYRGWGSAFIGDGLTSTELGDLRDIITTFNTTLGRNI